MWKYWPILAFLLIFTASCSPSTPAAPTQPPASPTPPASETPTLAASSTSLPLTLTPTLILFEGILAIKVNVRSGPGTSFDSLGLLDAGAKVQILNKDKSSSWYQILYSASPQGRGWVAAQYVQVPAGTQIPQDVTPTPAGPLGIVTQRLNVRSGPATTFDSLGVLEPNSSVSLTGKNSTASWFQIAYVSAPAGTGWVTAQYIQTEAAAVLPVLDEYGTPVAPNLIGTPSGAPMTPTPTIGPAFADGDSRTAPAVQVVFTLLGTHKITYSSQVSAPTGDLEDWVEFTPYAAKGTQARLLLSLSCHGNGALTVNLWQGGTVLSGWGSLICGDLERPLTLSVGQPYTLQLSATAGPDLRLVDYTLTVVDNPY